MCLFVVCPGSEEEASEGWCTAVTRPRSGCDGEWMASDSQAQTGVVVLVVMMMVVMMVMVIVMMVVIM